MGKMAKEEKKIFKDFETISKQTVPKPKYFKNILLAFIVGGAICTIGQFILNMLIKFGSLLRSMPLLLRYISEMLC